MKNWQIVPIKVRQLPLNANNVENYSLGQDCRRNVGTLGGNKTDNFSNLIEINISFDNI